MALTIDDVVVFEIESAFRAGIRQSRESIDLRPNRERPELLPSPCQSAGPRPRARPVIISVRGGYWLPFGGRDYPFLPRRAIFCRR